jgi:hypothetical protein
MISPGWEEKDGAQVDPIKTVAAFARSIWAEQPLDTACNASGRLESRRYDCRR